MANVPSKKILIYAEAKEKLPQATYTVQAFIVAKSGEVLTSGSSLRIWHVEAVVS
jgi:hypothetical protein